MPPEPDSAGDPIASIFLLIILVLINAFFSASEIAIITLNDNKIKKMAEEGHKKAQGVMKLTANSSRFLSTIQIGVTLAGFLSSASAAQSFSGGLATALHAIFPSVPSAALVTASTVIITLLLSYFSLVFGELVPKKVAMQKSELLAFKFVGVLNATAAIFRPFIALLTGSTNLVLKLFGLDPNQGEQTVTEEEILMMVDAGEERGVIAETAKDMISNIFDFSDITAVEAMTHRTDVGAVEDTSDIADVVRISMEEGYSRIPVYHEDLDNILGIVYVKDLLRFVGSPLEKGTKLTDLMRPAYFVPESKRCSELFKEMTDRKLQIAIIVDEYGGTEGIVTMEDLLESIVGNIQDEYDHEEEEIRQLGENAFTVDGAASIDEISDLTGVILPDGGDYDTIAGFVVDRLARIPAPGEHPSVRYENLTFTVQQVEDRRLVKLLVEKLPELSKEEAEEQAGKKK